MTPNERAKKLVKIYQNERALENAEEKLQGALVNYKMPEVKTLDAVIQRCSASEDGFDEVEEIEPEAGDDGDPGEFLDDEDAEELFHLMEEPAPAYGDDDTAVTVESVNLMAMRVSLMTRNLPTTMMAHHQGPAHQLTMMLTLKKPRQGQGQERGH